jgi:Dyp-type peroxidase family
MPAQHVDAHIQSLVFTGFGTLPHASVVRVTGITPAWLAMALPHVSFGRQRREVAAQLMLTSVGLRALGVSTGELEHLGREFEQGASSLPSRSRLGDALPGGSEDQLNWNDRGHDAALVLYGRDAHRTRPHFEPLLAGLKELGREELRLPASGREPFGFRDGISNIKLRRNRETGSDEVPDGEILLGRPTHPGHAYDPGPLGRDGSFVAMRQLRQDVRSFWSFWMRIAEGDPALAILLASKSVGRWPNGMPIQPGQSVEPSVAKQALQIRSFADDRLGQGCPFGSHVRRAHPRDTLVEDAAISTEISGLHRILRRGRVFGPDAPAPFYPPVLRGAVASGDESSADVPRGLMFIGLCSSLRRQFEFTHQNWFNFPKHMNLFQEVDPLLHRQGMPDGFGIPTVTFHRYLRKVGGWVHPVGGGYYLLPSRDALARLSGQRPD